MNKSIIFILLLLTYNIVASASSQTTTDHSITIFIHGTTPIRKFLEYSPARPFMYAPQGLNLAKELPHNYHFHKIAQNCVDLNAKSYSLDQFYIFGWKSEKVYDSTRQQAAQDLVNELQKLVNGYYLEHHVIPRVQLIGFSHGGNVVLNTANYLPLIVQNKKIKVEAWLFGTPVQQVNCDLINSDTARF